MLPKNLEYYFDLRHKREMHKPDDEKKFPCPHCPRGIVVVFAIIVVVVSVDVFCSLLENMEVH